MNRPRPITRAICCILLGVITTIAFSWGCVLRSHFLGFDVSVHCDVRPEVKSSDQRYHSQWTVFRHANVGHERYFARCLIRDDTGDTSTPDTDALPGYGDLGRFKSGAKPGPSPDNEGWTVIMLQDGSGWPMTALWCRFDVTPRPRSYHISFGNAGGKISHRVQISDESRLVTSLSRGGIGLRIPANQSLIYVQEPTALPIRPVWTGLLVNSLFFATGWLVFIQLLVFLRSIPRAIRRRRGRCESCGYVLHGITSSRCPECGTEVRPNEESSRRA